MGKSRVRSEELGVRSEEFDRQIDLARFEFMCDMGEKMEYDKSLSRIADKYGWSLTETESHLKGIKWIQCINVSSALKYWSEL